MSSGFQFLTEKEKQTLRLMGRGHDAKSMARHLGLSVHTVNERLRAARRKLSVSSSREAARLLLESEGDYPNSLGDKELGEAGPVQDGSGNVQPIDSQGRTRRAARVIAGALIMFTILAATALALLPQPASAPAQGSASVSAAQAEVTRAARAWLALVDARRWDESWRDTAASLRALNTAEKWAEVSEQVRVPFGAALSRVELSQESVPAPPSGYEMIKFRTRFANKAEAVETLTLVREEGGWRVSGYIID